MLVLLFYAVLSIFITLFLYEVFQIIVTNVYTLKHKQHKNNNNEM